MKNIFKKSFSLIIALEMTFSMALSSFAYVKNDKAEITNTGISLKIPQTLNITSPDKDITTSDSSYTVYGTSNPDLPLYLNDEEITDRGVQGSFAVKLNLADGKNRVKFSQGSKSKTVYITKTQISPYTATNITNSYPTVTQIVPSGDEITLKCTAPAGSRVYANFMGKTYELEQNVSSASKGIAAVFSLKITVPNVNKADNYGNITYTLLNNGNKSSYQSQGELFVSPKNKDILVQSTQVAAAVYEGNNTNTNIKTVLSHSTIDKVVNQNENMYELSMGGWIPKSLVKPIIGNYSHINYVKSLRRDYNDLGESYILKGNSYPPFIADNTSDYLRITLFNTKNVNGFSADESTIFSSIDTVESNGNTIITFHKKNSKSLWGYGIEYNQGETVIYCRKPPVVSGNEDFPLEGLVVAIDPGHGGTDPGALGVARLTGPTEKDLTLATSIAVKNRLESLGAVVVMAREDDEKVNFNHRMNTAIKQRADFFISIHYNSSLNPTAEGYEVYFYNDESKAFAKNIENALVNNTNRKNRGIIKTPFRVVLDTYCPSVLTEVEFISSPKGYDNSCSNQNIYEVANAMADAIINSL